MTKKMQERAITASEKFVTRRGYEVLGTNWSPEEGIAIDLVAEDDGTIVFIDVNAREGIDKGMPEENISGKRERMEIAAAKWLAENAVDEVRFAVIEFIESYYNRRRPHSTIGYQIPAEAMDAFFKRTKPKEEALMAA